MTTLFIYLIKVNVALILFCMGYYLVLRLLTFYTLNRFYLVGAILFSTLYPLLNFSNFINRHQQIARPVQMVVVNWQAPVANVMHTVAAQPNSRNWPLLIFWVGVSVFAVRFMVQIISLYRLHRRSVPMLLHRHLIRSVNKDINPFSFLKSIYVNPKNHQPDELRSILEHEQVHVNEWHTFDILVGELSIIFYWFNPGVWLMKRAIHENIEYLTDRRILQNGLDAKAYQYSLLTVNFNNSGNTLINHFNASAIKKRIVMMNAEKSSLLNITRYLFLLPIVAVLLLAFTVSKTELGKQVLKGKITVINALKTMATDAEQVSPVAVLSANNRPSVQLLDAVTPGNLDEQPIEQRAPAIFPQAIKVKNDSLNRVLPLTVYPDSIYLNGIYGETKSLLRFLKEDDIAAMTQTFIRRNDPDPNNQLIEAYTKDVKDYRPILAMDEEISRIINRPVLRVIRINGVLSSKEGLQKIPVEQIQRIQFYWQNAEGERGSYMWITTKQ